ncbi:MAG: methionine adenosyltransferase [Chloroflexota bacterium]
MSTTFMRAPSLLFTSESVTEGHPDKLCDQISDAVLDEVFAHDPYGRVACEVAVTTGLIIIVGEITTAHPVDYPEVARRVIREVGYTSPEACFDATVSGVIVSVKQQSPDIALGVDRSLEAKLGETEEELESLGAGDQGIMVGFACTETPELMPLPIMLAHRLCRRLAEVRKKGILPYLLPDGKAQVTVEYSHGIPRQVQTVVVSAQHRPGVHERQIRDDIIQAVVEEVIPRKLLSPETKFLVNPTGRFVIGGPMGDAGLTGRKIMVDTYGGMARHGGGCFSGKDPTKVDRSGAYAARYVAKNLVAAGIAERVEVQIAYAIGVARPVSIGVETFGTARIPDEQIIKLIQQHFDLRPGAIIRDLRLRRPIYRPTAVYGHFGRTDIDAPWEETDKAELLREAAGLRGEPEQPVYARFLAD